MKSAMNRLRVPPMQDKVMAFIFSRTLLSAFGVLKYDEFYTYRLGPPGGRPWP